MKQFKDLLVITLLFGLCFSAPISADEHTIAQNKAYKVNIVNGKEHYLTCAFCHSPQGWGTADGYYPQLSGQLPNVLIKQLMDIKQGNRDVPTMIPFADAIFSQTEQDVVDLVAYISALPMHPENSRGKGDELVKGEQLYKQHCQSCHGQNAEGDNDKDYPLLQGQHYEYMLRQLRWFKQDKRKNGNLAMLNSLKTLSDSDFQAVSDYISRIKPRVDLLAKNKNWKNPDFDVDFVSAPWIMRNKKSSEQKK